MKQRVVDYIADFFVSKGILDVFTVVGGGAMHLNDAFGHNKELHCTYNHHEQACAIAAEGYVRINNKLPIVCVTTGPGGTNALTGVVGAWLDSISMFVVSGQVRYDTTARSSGLNIRAMGDQEFDITKTVKNMTKYAEMVIDANDIKYHLEKAYFLAKTGRPGPVWLDIPLNIQAQIIETDHLKIFDAKKEFSKKTGVSNATVSFILKKIKKAKRPVINAGNAIRTAGAYENFKRLVKNLNIPVVTGWDSIDLIEDDNELYIGRAGIMGDRAGNFAIQNSDLILSLGSRLSIRQVGYNYKTWAREAYTIVVDIDEDELKKPTLHVSLPVCDDVSNVINKLNATINECPLFIDTNWIKICNNWKKDYPVVLPKHYKNTDFTNVYAFIKTVSNYIPNDAITVVGNGSACVVGSHAYTIKNNSRFIINSAIASMGYGLPAAIGACLANNKQQIICITGDGSIQMNIQELQTVVTNKLPIKIFVINNQGYHSIRQTQNKFFGPVTVGIGPESHDLDFPSMKKMSTVYGLEYFSCRFNSLLDDFIKDVFKNEGACIAEVFVDTKQKFEPKAASKRLDDGTIVSAPLEDLAPFLPREELAKNMYIPLVTE